MAVTRQSTPRQIMTWYRGTNGPIEYFTALRVLHAINGDEHTEQSRQSALLPSYAHHILAADPTATVKLQIINNRFSTFFVAPTASKMAWPHLRPFIAIDAAFTKVIHNYVLLIATALDANNEAINLAWGIAPKENLDH